MMAFQDHGDCEEGVGLKYEWSDQYQCTCVIVTNIADIKADDIISACHRLGAFTMFDGLEYCVQFRQAIGPELWTAEGLRRSCKGK